MTPSTHRAIPVRLVLVALCLAGGPAPPALAEGVFEDRAAATGLDFVHFNGMSGRLYFPEMTGQGGALLDYDGDGDLDVYLVQGNMLGGRPLSEALAAPPPGSPTGDRLFRNDLAPGADGALEPRFVDVTEAAGIDAGGYGMGVATGDADGDGDVDLYVTNYGSNQLWVNEGDGTFTDVTAAAGADDPRWSTSASFVDFDRDGRLDLYVVNYVEFDLERNPACYATSSRRDYCGPSGFQPQGDRLLRNTGDGRFEDVTLRALPGYAAGPGLGVVAADLDGDAWPDLYVANDGAPNQFWINRRDGTFREEALLAGVAVNREGRAEASMGVDAADFDGDGDDDLFMTHLMGETNTLYVNLGGGLFEDRSIETGVGGASMPYTAFGTGWLDYDNDGWLDLLVLNGAVRILEDQVAAGDTYPLKQPNQLFRGTGNGGLSDASALAGETFGLLEVSRGLALGDVDNDGDEDAVQFNNNGPVRLLVNRAGDGSPWIGVRAIDGRSGGVAIGARAIARLGDGRSVARRARSDGSYCSARDPRMSLGLGGERLMRVEVIHPAGERRAWLDPPTGFYLTTWE